MSRARHRAGLALAVFIAGCGGESIDGTSSSSSGDPPFIPEAEHCAPVDVAHPARFSECTLGGGIFGVWTVDGHGLPAYDYLLDENQDERARYFNTEGLDRRDHWAAFGNARINAMVANDGYVVVATQDRGPTLLDAFDEDQKNFAGGYGYVDDGEATWCTAYKWRPEGAKTTRRFGAGYAESATSFRDVSVSRRLVAPPGDAALIVDEVTLKNQGSSVKHLRYYEVWDVARRPIEINWLVSGSVVKGAPEFARKKRDLRNAMFDEQVKWEESSRRLSLSRTYIGREKRPSIDAPNSVDYYPGDPFLIALSNDAEVVDVFADQESFFGEGGIAAPESVTKRRGGRGIASGPVGSAQNGQGQHTAFVLRTDVDLGPDESKTLRFGYGYAPFGETPDVDSTLGDPSRDLEAEIEDRVKASTMLFASERDPVLHRELAWHASQLEASVGRRDYWNVHVVPQGSAYLYLHGADGAPRDLALTAIPLVYTHPSLAKEELSLAMMVTHAKDGRLTYAFQGHGELDDALGLHEDPSDLTIFLLWALSEYVGATGDVGFLDAPMPYWPLDESPGGATTWTHLEGAVRYLFDHVGTGPHGLVRLQSGDWNDGIVLLAANRDLAIAKGESVPNTQMAIAILPRVADLVESRDAALAAEIRVQVKNLRAALPSAWAGKFFGRAYFGDGKLAGADGVDLEAQVWALVGDTFPSETDRDSVVAAIENELDRPSLNGATLVKNGQIWPAISGLLTWGLTRVDGDLAWQHLVRNTMQAHARAFPDVWSGIWSGPDGSNGKGGDRPGEPWFSQVTPMTDFPVQNSNQHAMPMLAALRVAGIEASATGLVIAPRAPPGDYALETQLVDLARDKDVVRGVYRPIAAGARTIELVAPPGAFIKNATIDGAPLQVEAGSESIVASAISSGQPVTFSFRLAPR